VIPALQSRCQSLDLTPPIDGCKSRIDYILKEEGIEVSDDQNNVLLKFVKSNYPDLRRIVNEVQKFCINGKLKILNTSNCDELIKQIWLLTSNGHILKARKYIIENEEKFGSDYQRLLKALFDFIDNNKNINDDKKKMYLVIIAESLYRSAFVADQEINCYSCLIQITQH